MLPPLAQGESLLHPSYKASTPSASLQQELHTPSTAAAIVYKSSAQSDTAQERESTFPKRRVSLHHTQCTIATTRHHKLVDINDQQKRRYSYAVNFEKHRYSETGIQFSFLFNFII
jgi:hypothetical protein